jgi:hypothetical protein
MRACFTSSRLIHYTPHPRPNPYGSKKRTSDFVTAPNAPRPTRGAGDRSCACGSAHGTWTQSSQVLERINPAVVPVAPDEVDGVPADRRDTRRLHLPRLQHGSTQNGEAQSSAGGSLASLVVAEGARTLPAKQVERIRTLVTVRPAHAQFALLATDGNVGRIGRVGLAHGGPPNGIADCRLQIADCRSQIAYTVRRFEPPNRQSSIDNSSSTRAATETKRPSPPPPRESSPCPGRRWKGSCGRAPLAR